MASSKKPKQESKLTAKHNDNAAPSNGAERQLTEIRNLLFSETVQEIKSEVVNNFDLHEKRLDELNQLIEKNTSNINEQLALQVSQLQEALSQQQTALDNSEGGLKNELDNLHDQVEQNRNWVEKENQKTLDNIQKNFDSTNARMEEVTNALIDNKVDKKTLAKMFCQLAASLDPDLENNGNPKKSK